MRAVRRGIRLRHRDPAGRRRGDVPGAAQAGYPKSFAIGALCAAGTLGIIVPPSIPLILYGVMTQTSIADLFIAGIGPSCLLVLLMATYALARNRGLAASPLSWREIRASFREGVWALLMPVLILGGIYSGYFTATESAAVAVVYAIFVETFVYREMHFADLYAVIGHTTKLLGSLFPVLMLALSLNVFLAYQQVPELLVGTLEGLISSRTTFLIGMNLFLLAVGCVMDIGSAILILAPMLQPLAASQGIDPVHFGIITVVNLEIGYLTPPLGLNLIVAMTVFREDFWTICRAVLPFLALMLLGSDDRCVRADAVAVPRDVTPARCGRRNDIYAATGAGQGLQYAASIRRQPIIKNGAGFIRDTRRTS